MIEERPSMGMLVYADQSQQGKPALPVTRHIQVEWEWCPMTVPRERTPTATASG